MMMPLLDADLDAVVDRTADLFETLRGERIFVSGGTGFFGTWLLSAFVHARDRLSTGSRVVVLSRNPDAFRQRLPWLAGHPCVETIAGDVRDFAWPDGTFAAVVHAATESVGTLERDDPAAMIDVIRRGTGRMLDLARARGAGRFLLASSGAVYGRQPPDIERIPEAFAWRGDETTAYAAGKRAAEALCLEARDGPGPGIVIARGFAFVGPILPLSAHFAIGNFIRDALEGGPIRVRGDGTALRSYLYASDLAGWLWTLLLRGPAGSTFNVGSDRAVSVGDLARIVAAVAGLPPSSVVIEGTPEPGRPPERYVPCVDLARSVLGLDATVKLEDAVRRTIEYHRWRRSAML